MDSLTQMALGAAVGELVLGRKIGNKAMFWGAVGATIPDLDILANPFLSDAYSVKFHRGPSHSFFFAAIFSAFAAYVMVRYFNSPLFHKKWWRLMWKYIFTGLPVALGMGILIAGVGTLSFTALLTLSLILGFTAFLAYRRSPVHQQNFEQPDYRQWYWFYFWVIATHIVLDICTTYGTQALWPFTDYPFALDNISIVDPVYTIPLLFSSLIASFFSRSDSRRKIFNRLGLVVSSLFIIFTLFNKSQVHSVFEQTLETEELVYQKTKITPTLFNNLLWYGVAELDEHFVMGYYSVLDEQAEFSDMQFIPKNHHLLEPYPHSPDLRHLKWFSRGYFSVEAANGVYYWYDLRFGNIDFTGGEPELRSPFYFELIPDREKGELKVRRSRPDFRGDVGEIWSTYWERVWGISAVRDQ